MATRKGRPSRWYPFASKREMDATRELSRRLVAEAIAAGTLKKERCQVCGDEAEAHHDDYSQPLQVRWLCRAHHIAWHSARAAVPRAEKFAVPVTRRGYRANATHAYHGQGVVAEATNAIVAAMELEGVNQSALAKRIGCHSVTVYRSLGAGVRTLRILATFAGALGYDVHVSLVKRVARSEVA